MILGACRGLLRVTSATMVAEERRRPGVSAGLVSGIYNAGSDLADLFSPPLVGALAAVLTIPTTFTVVGIALPAVYYAVWLAVRNWASTCRNAHLIHARRRIPAVRCPMAPGLGRPRLPRRHGNLGTESVAYVARR